MELVNLWQSSEERRDKYKLTILMGATWENAQRMRDWRLAKIERYFGIVQSNYTNREEHDQQLDNLLANAN